MEQMKLTKEDRNRLFGTEDIKEQFIFFLSSRIEKTCSAEELRDTFHDVSKGLFFSTLIWLSTKKIIKQDEDKIVLLRRPEKDNLRDQVWNAAKILRRFSVADINNLLPDARAKSISNILRSWELEGIIQAVASDPGKTKIYILPKDYFYRPKKSQQKEKAVPKYISEKLCSLIRIVCMESMKSFIAKEAYRANSSRLIRLVLQEA